MPQIDLDCSGMGAALRRIEHLVETHVSWAHDVHYELASAHGRWRISIVCALKPHAIDVRPVQYITEFFDALKALRRETPALESIRILHVIFHEGETESEEEG